MTESLPARTTSRDIWLSLYSLGVGSLGLLALVAVSRSLIWQKQAGWVLFFILLSMAVKRSGFHMVSRLSHSLVGIVDVAAILVFGPTIGGWVAALSGGLYLFLNALRRGRRYRRLLLELPVFYAGLRALMALVSGAFYQLAGGALPLTQLSLASLIPLVIAFATWFVLDHLGWAGWTWIKEGPDDLKSLLRAIWPISFLVELLPLPAAALIAPIFFWGWLPFLMFAVGLFVVSVVVQRLADAHLELQARIDNLSGLAETGRAIVEAQLDVDQLCELIYEQTSRIVDTSGFHLGLFDGDDLTLKVWIVAGQRRPPQTFKLAAGEGIVGWMRRSRQPLLVRDFAREMDTLPARPHYLSSNPPRSAVFVPLIAGEQVIGSLTIQSFEPAAYTTDHVRTLSLMANQAAAAIANARLLQQERLRARQLALVGQVSQQVAALRDVDSLFMQVVYLIQETFGYYHVGVFTTDPDAGLVYFQASTDPNISLADFVTPLGEGIIGWVAQNGRALLANDVSQEPRYRFADIWPNTHAELAVPLRLDDQIVGVLDVQSDRLYAFSEDDMFVLRSLADQIGVAIHNASLYDLERRRRQMAEVQRELAQALSATMELDLLLNLILVLLTQAIECDAALIVLRTDGGLAVRALQGEAVPDDLIGFVFQPGESARLDRLGNAQHPVLLNSGADASSADLLDTMLEIEVKSCLGAPLLAQESWLGGFVLLSQRSYSFTQEDVQAALIFASQAALALENARLYAAQQQEAWESTALLQVAEAVSSLNNLDDILATIVRITPILVGVVRCAILLWNDIDEVFVPAQQYGLSPEQSEVFRRLRLSAQAIGLRPGSTDAPLPPDDLWMLLNEQNLVLLPLETRGEILGLMIVTHDDRAYSGMERRSNILSGIANQAAVAIESDHLAREAAEQERLARELEVAQEIQASFLPEQNPDLPGWEIAAYWGAARSVGGDFYDFLRLSNGHLGLVIADVADKGIPAALFMALSRTLVRVSAFTGRGPAAALERANELILSDARSDLFVTVFYAVIDPITGHMVYTSAGHNPPLLVRAAGEVEVLRCQGIALGVLEEIQLYEKETTLQSGDLLILYTDGITEAINPQEEEFDLQRLIDIVRANKDEPALNILAYIAAAVSDFAAGEPQFDDMTCVIARRVVDQMA